MAAKRLAGSATLPAHVLRTILDGAERRGVARAALMERFAIAPELARDPDARAPAALLVRLWQEVPELAGDPDFGLHLGEESGASAMALAAHLVLASRTLGEGIDRVLGHARLFNDVHSVELHDEGDAVAIVVPSKTSPLPTPRHANEFAFAWVVTLARAATARPELAPIEVRFEHPPPADTREHARVFRCPVRFRQDAAAIVAPRALLGMETRSHDPALGELLESHARALLARMPRGPDVAARVRAAMAPLLARGEPSVDAIATSLGTTPRTLQRDLAGEGTTFQKVLGALRRDLAEQHLADPNLAIADVAMLLGFSDASAFHRAFVRWTGKSPKAFRDERALR